MKTKRNFLTYLMVRKNWWLPILLIFAISFPGLIINLPIMNYYEHGTYLTVNHGHAALMGVYGNLSIAAVLFCTRLMTKPSSWKPKLVRITFWSINIGLLLMVFLDLFPAIIHQLMTALQDGLWYARSQEFLMSTPFQTMTWLRIIGGAVFTVGGVFPLVWFISTRWKHLKPKFNNIDDMKTMPKEPELVTAGAPV